VNEPVAVPAPTVARILTVKSLIEELADPVSKITETSLGPLEDIVELPPVTPRLSRD
jgi:hypothetical protein